MPRSIRWGMIGCGDVTERKSGPAFQKAHGSSLVAVMRRNGELAKDYATRHGVARWYDDADKLISDAEVDAVYIATPPAFHKQYAMACARVAKPAYIEKPMAMDARECSEIVRAFDDAGVPLFVAYYRRALPRFERIRQWIDSGAIGAVRFVRMTQYRPISQRERDGGELPWRVIPELAGGGHFVDLACHTIDILSWMIGPFEDAHGFAANLGGLYPAEDTVAATFRFRSGALGTGLWCFSAAEREDETMIMGDTGCIRFSTFGDTPIRLCNREGVVEETILNPEHIQQPLIQTIVDELLGRGVCPSHGDTATHVSWVIDRVLDGWRNRSVKD